MKSVNRCRFCHIFIVLFSKCEVNVTFINPDSNKMNEITENSTRLGVVLFIFCWTNRNSISDAVKNLTHQEIYFAPLGANVPIITSCTLRNCLCFSRVKMEASVAVCYAVVTCEINYFKIISAFVYVPTKIILPKIISKLFHRLIAAHEYFPTCSMSLK